MLLRRTILALFTLAAKVSPVEVNMNYFAEAYNRWAAFRAEHSTQYSFHAKEPALWLVVKRAWKKFATEMDRFYGLRR
jgi:hypothetical protein